MPGCPDAAPPGWIQDAGPPGWIQERAAARPKNSRFTDGTSAARKTVKISKNIDIFFTLTYCKISKNHDIMYIEI